MRADRLNFLIAGVQKGGTTALWHFLRQHPGILLSDRKELHFFDNEDINWEDPDYSILHSHFPGCSGGRALGEATPIYVYWRPSMERIAAYNPAMKLIIALRDPICRAYSHWRMEVARNQETLSFSDAIREGRSRVSSDPRMPGQHRIFSYVERGFYADQVENILSFFPRSQVFFLNQSDLKTRHADTLRQVCHFLGIGMPDETIVSEFVFSHEGHAGPIPPVDVDYLGDVYRDDLRRLEVTTGVRFERRRSGGVKGLVSTIAKCARSIRGGY